VATLEEHGAPVTLALAVGAFAGALAGWRYQITWSSTDPCEQPSAAPGVAALGVSLAALASVLGAAMYLNVRVAVAALTASIAALASIALIYASVQGMTCKY
jgi:hypothetical protein